MNFVFRTYISLVKTVLIVNSQRLLIKSEEEPDDEGRDAERHQNRIQYP